VRTCGETPSALGSSSSTSESESESDSPSDSSSGCSAGQRRERGSCAPVAAASAAAALRRDRSDSQARCASCALVDAFPMPRHGTRSASSAGGVKPAVIPRSTRSSALIVQSLCAWHAEAEGD